MAKEKRQAEFDIDAERWRLEFPGLERRVHLANCSHSPQSQRVRSAIDAYLDSWLQEGMDWDEWLAEVAGAREGFARLIGARPHEIAIATSVSQAVASIASALTPNRDRNLVVTTEAEFPTVGHVWLAHRKYGLQVGFVPLRDGALEMEDYQRLVDQRTLITSATHVYYKNGFKQDIGEIARIAHSAGSLLLVDAYQSLGTCEIDVRALDVDILVGGSLTYLLGLPGIAFIYVKEELTERLAPALTGWFGRVDPFALQPTALDYAADARRLETGTPPIFAAAAARAGLEIINEVGADRIGRRIRHLSQHVRAVIDYHALEYAGPEDTERKGAVTAVRVPDPQHAERRLRALDIVAAARGDVIRLAPHFFNTADELDRAVSSIAALVRSE